MRFYQQRGAGIRWQSLQDLSPYIIGTVLDNAYSPEFDAADYLQKEVATSEVLNIRKLAAGRIDLFVMDRHVYQYLIHQLPEDRDSIEALEPVLQRNQLYVMFSRKSQAVEQKISAFNAGLAAIQRDGTLQQIIDRHLNAPDAPPPASGLRRDAAPTRPGYSD